MYIYIYASPHLLGFEHSVYFLCLNSCSIFVYIFNIGSLCIPFKYYAFSNAFRDINCQII